MRGIVLGYCSIQASVAQTTSMQATLTWVIKGLRSMNTNAYKSSHLGHHMQTPHKNTALIIVVPMCVCVCTQWIYRATMCQYMCTRLCQHSLSPVHCPALYHVSVMDSCAMTLLSRLHVTIVVTIHVQVHVHVTIVWVHVHVCTATMYCFT